MNAPAKIGHNAPPSALDTAKDTLADLTRYGDETPVCADHEKASEIKLMIDRGKAAMKEADGERDSKVRPLNEQVKATNAEYKAVSAPLETVVKALESRVRDFLRREEEKRIREAEEARRAAAEAERIAREAEAKEREAIENAAAGDIDAGAVSATLEADVAFAEYEKASRFAVVAERDQKVKVGGGFGRAMSLRTVEELAITDASAAVVAMRGDEELDEAIKTAARRHRKSWGELPPGVIANKVRV